MVVDKIHNFKARRFFAPAPSRARTAAYRADR
jgi:hypothetical protein